MGATAFHTKRLPVIGTSAVIAFAMLTACNSSSERAATGPTESPDRSGACNLVAAADVKAALETDVSQLPDPDPTICEFRWGPGGLEEQQRNIGPGYGTLTISIIGREEFEGLKSGEAGPKVNGVAEPMDPVGDVGDEAYMTKTVFPGAEPGVDGKAQAQLVIRTGDTFISMTLHDDRSPDSRPKKRALFNAVMTLGQTAVKNA